MDWGNYCCLPIKCTYTGIYFEKKYRPIRPYLGLYGYEICGRVTLYAVCETYTLFPASITTEKPVFPGKINATMTSYWCPIVGSCSSLNSLYAIYTHYSIMCIIEFPPLLSAHSASATDLACQPCLAQ